MKAVKVLFLAAVLLMGVNTAMAQSKIGHVDIATLISLMPEKKKADTQLETMGKGFQSDYEKMATEYQNLAQKYQNEASKQSEAMNQTRAKELQDREQRLQVFYQAAQQDLQKKENELLQPILQKVQDAINAVAKEKGLSYVFNGSNGIILYDGGGYDLLPDVKKKLGLQ